MMSFDNSAAESPGGSAPGSRERATELRPAMAAEFELRLLRRLRGLYGQFKDGHDPAKVPRAALRSGMELLAAPEGCVAVLAPEAEQAQVVFAVPRESRWDPQF